MPDEVSGNGKVLKIRPHHMLCLHMFTGHGYDERFTANMYDVMERLDDDVMVRISAGCDDICIACPHSKDGICEFQGSVLRKDLSVLTFFMLDDNIAMSSGEMRALVRGRISEIDDIRRICGECEWSSLCNEHLNRSNSANRRIK